MPDIDSILKNNPSSFANNVEISKSLCCYSKHGYNDKEQISVPKQRLPFQFNALGGVPLCYDSASEKIYVDNTDKHTLVIGQTGSKKSRLVAIPLAHILGLAGESMIISDPKGEIYDWSYNFLKKHKYNIKIINLRNPKQGNSWNPLALPYEFYKNKDIDHAYEFANDIAVNLTVIDKSEKEAFWDNSAGSVFFGLMLLLFKYCYEHHEPDESVCIKNILELRNALFEAKQPENTNIWKYAMQDHFIKSVLVGTVETANDTRKGVLSSLDQKMRAFYINPSLLDMLRRDDNTFEHIMEKPTAVFIILPDEKTSHHNLVSLYVKQSYEYIIYRAQQGHKNNLTEQVRVNYILDEFSSLPTIADFPAMITAARSRNIRFNLFLQSKNQLKMRYAEDCSTIMSNCENWIYLSSRELELLKEISELCGECSGGSHKALLSISDLQHFDKGKGQVLVLTARRKPMISNLPDISFYPTEVMNNEIHLIENVSPKLQESDDSFILRFKKSIDELFQTQPDKPKPTTIFQENKVPDFRFIHDIQTKHQEIIQRLSRLEKKVEILTQERKKTLLSAITQVIRRDSDEL